MNVSVQILQILKNSNVTQIWGLITDALNTFTDALCDNFAYNSIIIDAVNNSSELSVPEQISLEEACGFGKYKVQKILFSVKGDIYIKK